MQDGYINYDYSTAIKKRVDEALKLLTHNDLGNRRDAGPIGGASVLTDELCIAGLKCHT
jgi:hypothetical protein